MTQYLEMLKEKIRKDGRWNDCKYPVMSALTFLNAEGLLQSDKLIELIEIFVNSQYKYHDDHEVPVKFAVDFGAFNDLVEGLARIKKEMNDGSQ